MGLTAQDIRENVQRDGADGAQFQVRPFAQARQFWRDQIARLPGATLYHREPWLEVLHRCYRLKLHVATLGPGSIRAACVMARGGSPLSRRLVALPFSDYCAPLAVDREAEQRLLTEMIRHLPGERMEFRGANAPPPWRTVDCFQRWTLDLTAPLPVIERGIARGFRTNFRSALKAGVKVERGCGPEHVERFYTLQLETRRRHGVPPQPLRLFRIVREVFTRDDSCDVWLASAQGKDIGALFVLRDGGDLYMKWSARRPSTINGASHLLVFSMIEEFAGKARQLDPGRADVRNPGLTRFKNEMGARPASLPYSYFPEPRRQISAEVLQGPAKLASQLWRRLPLPVTRLLGSALYGYFA
jgi:Acetyltransferase (GNAT) domain